MPEPLSARRPPALAVSKAGGGKIGATVCDCYGGTRGYRTTSTPHPLEGALPLGTSLFSKVRVHVHEHRNGPGNMDLFKRKAKDAAAMGDGHKRDQRTHATIGAMERGAVEAMVRRMLRRRESDSRHHVIT